MKDSDSKKNDPEVSEKVGPGRPRGPRKRAPLEAPVRIAWTVQETAQACGCGAQIVYRAIRDGELRVCKLGRQCIRVLPSEALAWLENCLTDKLTPALDAQLGDGAEGSEEDET